MVQQETTKYKVRKILFSPSADTQTVKINGQELTFSHLNKLYWPQDGITKRDMLRYYHEVAAYILPYLTDKPMSLHRFPDGINGSGFYQKDIHGIVPEWITKTLPYTGGSGKLKEYLVGHDEACLLWPASLGCIEVNPGLSRIQSPNNRDYCVIDLDPDKHRFDQVIEVARVVKEVLDTIKVPTCCKTSGPTSIHIYISLAAKYPYTASLSFARMIAGIVHAQLRDLTSLERFPKNREGKIYFDFLQNKPGATVASPYSLRPRRGATVSMPLRLGRIEARGCKIR